MVRIPFQPEALNPAAAKSEPSAQWRARTTCGQTGCAVWQFHCPFAQSRPAQLPGFVKLQNDTEMKQPPGQSDKSSKAQFWRTGIEADRHDRSSSHAIVSRLHMMKNVGNCVVTLLEKQLFLIPSEESQIQSAVLFMQNIVTRICVCGKTAHCDTPVPTHLFEPLQEKCLFCSCLSVCSRLSKDEERFQAEIKSCI